MKKLKDRNKKKISMGKSVLIGFMISAAVILLISAIGTHFINVEKIAESEISGVVIAAIFLGALAGNFCCLKIGGGVRGGLLLTAALLGLRIICGAFAENGLICMSVLSSVMALIIGGFFGALLSKRRKKRKRA